MSPETSQRMTTQEIFDLLKAENLQTQTGRIEVFFAGITLLVKDKSYEAHLQTSIDSAE